MENTKEMTRKKIVNLIVSVSLLMVLNISLIFATIINDWLVNTLESNFNIISSNNNLRVHFISVGNGDAIAINLPDRKTMLIDTGTSKSANRYVKYIEQKVLPFDDDGKIDYLILSHADADHIGGTSSLLDRVEVEMTYVPWLDSESDSETYKKARISIETNSVFATTDKNMLIEGGDYRINFLGPVMLTSTNNSCQIIRLSYRDKVFLFTGDVDEKTEGKFIESYGEELDCDVLKVAHHGSNSSTSEVFVESASPMISVISVGLYNSYNHPREDVLNRLTDSGSEIYRTDLDGNVMIVLGDKYNMLVKTGSYTIIDLPIDFRIILFIIDVAIVIRLSFVLIKKDKVKYSNFSKQAEETNKKLKIIQKEH